MTTKVVGYARVSTREQAEEGVSLMAQQSRITAYSMGKGWSLAKIYTDDATGRNLDRPGLRQLIQDIKGDGVDGVVILKLDRLVRSVRYLGELVDDLFNGLFLCSIEEGFDSNTVGGRMMMHLFGTIGEWESGVISERVKSAVKYRREQGQWVGGNPPYGYRVKDHHLVRHEEEQRIITAIRQSHGAGHLSMGKLAKKYGLSSATVCNLIHRDRRSREWREKTRREKA